MNDYTPNNFKSAQNAHERHWEWYQHNNYVGLLTKDKNIDVEQFDDLIFDERVQPFEDYYMYIFKNK